MLSQHIVHCPSMEKFQCFVFVILKPSQRDPSYTCGTVYSSSETYTSVYGTGMYFLIITLKHVENDHNFSQKTARDGGWTEWGEWGSLCTVNCSVTRNRTCTNPTPLFGGSDCQGDEVEESSERCYGGDCCPGYISTF